MANSHNQPNHHLPYKSPLEWAVLKIIIGLCTTGLLANFGVLWSINARQARDEQAIQTNKEAIEKLHINQITSSEIKRLDEKIDSLKSDVSEIKDHLKSD